ncbi:YHYH protein [Aquimarina pacifica]|uniref:YHYH protein n=1 Tax=Aquimarina pacifica TaxID=1296415 RepID=UPI000687F575|nr:YHYH protein [Aquimarina pacifica]
MKNCNPKPRNLFIKSLSISLFSFLILSSAYSCSSDSSSDDIEIDEDSGSDDGDTGSTGDTGDTEINITSILSKFDGTGLSYEISGDNVIFTSSDLPNHTSPYWPEDNDLHSDYTGVNPDWRQNPNEIAEQNIVFTIPLSPAEATDHESTPLGAMGIARNGIPFFNQYAGPDQPLTDEINSFDQWLGHPTGTSIYHYHIEPTYLTQEYGEDAFLGLLSDGFPVYGPVENGEEITNDDLDEYHGHVSATADFPNGIYHYHITSNDPYINGNGYFGTPGNTTF